ncbi:MAG: hypothetical protein V3R25_08900 [Nitrosomonadaceae bacterium]
MSANGKANPQISPLKGGNVLPKAVLYMTPDNRPVCGFIADGYLGTWLLYFLRLRSR